MIDKELLNILCCPETKQNLAAAEDAVIKNINSAIKAGKITNRSGAAVKEPIDGGLLREDGKYLYPVR
ncbi:MAG: hypothetical protein LBC70_06825 [Chitinispirillales bacterium]|jgi:uncharacterized protein YbaR (Trm112 family)|nr:hypothetical protein [Chitinispirillales bacterium]